MLSISNLDDRSITFPVVSKVLPGGEVHPSIDPVIAKWYGVILTAHLRNSVDIMELLTVTDAIRRLNPALKIHLWMPYLPYARQDRVPNRGESLTIKVFCDLINSQRYDIVTVLDAHSEVGVALLDRVRHYTLPQAAAYCMSKRNWNRTVLVAPDAGAMKKTLELANLVGCPRVVCAFKDRDTVTGKITATRVDMTFTPTLDQDWLVVDDICDGGYTFIELAKVLRTMFDEHGLTNRLELWVSHGLFTKGYDVLKEHYARIETTNSWNALGSYNTQPDGTHDAAIYWHPVQGIFA